MAIFEIHKMTLSDLEMVVGWARGEGWNPGNYDFQSFHEADADGFFVGSLNGVPMASISAVKYSEEYAFVGFYIVKAEFRGLGYGRQIWQHAMDSLATRNVRNVGLDALLAMESTYAKCGFRTADTHIRYGGVISADTAEHEKGEEDGDVLRDLGEVDFEQLLDFDAAAFPARRPAFLRSWIRQPESIALACMRGNQLVGYGVVRPAHAGHRVGPLLADGPAVADRLLRALAARCDAAAGPVFVDVPASNADAVALAERCGMARAFATARMYTHGPPACPARGRIFGVTSLELG